MNGIIKNNKYILPRKPLLSFKEHLLLIFAALELDKTDRASGQEKFDSFLYLIETEGNTLSQNGFEG
jgi:hypothetical protein